MDTLTDNTSGQVPRTSKWVKGQWPDDICSGFITYTASDARWNPGGFILRDASHGIPVFGSVKGETFNYPGQTEAITRRLVAAWNASVGVSIEELEQRAAKNADYPAVTIGKYGFTCQSCGATFESTMDADGPKVAEEAHRQASAAGWCYLLGRDVASASGYGPNVTCKACSTDVGGEQFADAVPL